MQLMLHVASCVLKRRRAAVRGMVDICRRLRYRCAVRYLKLAGSMAKLKPVQPSTAIPSMKCFVRSTPFASGATKTSGLRGIGCGSTYLALK